MVVRGRGTADDLRELILSEINRIQDFEDTMGSCAWDGAVTPKAFKSLENFKAAIRVRNANDDERVWYQRRELKVN